MNNLVFLLNNQVVPPPDNWQALMIQVSFMDDDPEAALNATLLKWKGANATIINNWLHTGLQAGGLGIFEGIPFELQTDTGLVCFNGIGSLSAADTKYNCDIVEIVIRDMREDMVNQLFDSISFSYLATPFQNGGPAYGPWSIGLYSNGTPYAGDYIPIPYQINNVPDYFELATSVLALVQTIEQVEKLIKEIKGLFAAYKTAFKSQITIPAALGLLIATIEWVAEIIITFGMLDALLNSAVKQFTGGTYFNGTDWVPMYKYGMNVLTMIQKACAYFGVGFESTILEGAMANLAIMPEKGAWANVPTYKSVVSSTLLFGSFTAQANFRKMYDDFVNFQNGGFAYGYYDGTPKQLFDSLGDVFNAKARIILDANGNPTIHFENWDALELDSGLTMPNISEDAPFPQPFKTNASQLSSNYLVQYQKDSMDSNTYDSYDGTLCQVTFTPINISNLTNVTLTNLVTKNLAFAQGLRKTNPTTAEQIFEGLTDAISVAVSPITATIDAIIGLVNTITSLFNVDPIQSIPLLFLQYTPPTGNLLLTDNSTGVQKLILLNTNVPTDHVQLDPSNHTPSDPIGARKLVKNYHYSSLMYTKDPNGNPYWNQWYIYENQTIPLCGTDFASVYNMNYMSTWDNKKARVQSMKWTTFKGMANIDYWVRTLYTTNVQPSFCIDGITTTNDPMQL